MIEIKSLTKTYDKAIAVDNISLKIETGEFFGLLGPNGAGKSTTIGMLSTLLIPKKGEIFIDGQQLVRSNSQLKKKIAVVTQEYSMRQDMTLEEVMEYQGRLYFIPKKERKERTRELFEFTNLTQHRLKTVRQLSGGMKRLLMVARALLLKPEILLLDEPTAGMDVMARRRMWSLLKKLNKAGLTIILTTHYIEEAQSLCERVAFIDKGRIEAIDSPSAFIESLGAYAVDMQKGEEVSTAYFKNKGAALEMAANTSGECTLRSTTLEDVYVSVVGHNIAKDVK